MINYAELKEDVIESMATYIDRDKSDVAKHIENEDLEYILDQMFEAETQAIIYLSNELENRIIDAAKTE